MGIRLNRSPPQIYFKKNKTGGINFSSTVPLTHLDDKLVDHILHGERRNSSAVSSAAHSFDTRCFFSMPRTEYRIHNAEVLFREDATVDDLIDVIEGAPSC